MLKVVSVDNMRKSDALAVERVSSAELMERAGKAIFDAAEWRAPVAIVCGTGNNAGDGFVVASHIKNAGIPCTIFILEDKMSDVSRPFFERCTAENVNIRRGIDALCLDGFNTVLDCIFGTGFKGEVKEPYRTAITRINESGAYIVSADINSGLGGDSGLCDICVHSDLTVSVGSYKSGHFLNSAKDVMKKKVNCDIGIYIADEPAYLIERDDIRHLFMERPNSSNKGDYGYVALMGGSRQYSGAVKLANLSLSALRSGAGVAKLAVPDCIVDGVMPYILESTLFPLDSSDGAYSFSYTTTENLLRRTSAVAVGMGMGATNDVKLLLEYMLCEYSGRLVVDADGLNALSKIDRKRFKNASCHLILTPHPKEFERLCGEKLEDFKHDLVTAAKNYAKETGTILLLKGTTTIVTDGYQTYLIDRGCAGMATAGSGDVLSGILAGIMGYVSDDALLLGVAAGAYLAGVAGEVASRTIPQASMIASDTVNAIPQAMREIIG